eukprot:6172556-Prymnesium_polylepis.2
MVQSHRMSNRLLCKALGRCRSATWTVCWFGGATGQLLEEEEERSLPFGGGPHAPARWECQATLAGAGS